MKFSEIATVSGKSGLFKVLSVSRSGLILESLDAQKTRLVTSPSSKVSLLEEISIYTTTRERSVPLEEVLKKIYSEFGNDPGVDPQSGDSELRAFLKSVLPEYDEGRVYISDIKKLVRWYAILASEAPDILKEEKAASGTSKSAEDTKDQEK